MRMDAKSISKAITQYLDRMGVDVQVLEKDAMLLFRTELADDTNDAPAVIYCVISIEDSMYTVYTTSTDLSDSDAILAAITPVSELIVRANWYCSPGHFDLNADTGDIRYRNCVFCDTLPNDESIHENIDIAVEQITAFSDDARKVVLEHKSPRDVIRQAQTNARQIFVENDFYHFLVSHLDDDEESETDRGSGEDPEKKTEKDPE